jgi:hypothetical protein
MVDDYFIDIVHFSSIGMAPSDMRVTQKKYLVLKDEDYQLIVGILYKLGTNGILRRCVVKHERPTILAEVHNRIAGGNYEGKYTVQKILCTGLWWPILHKDAK